MSRIVQLGSIAVTVLLLTCLFIVYGTNLVAAEQDGDYTYTVIDGEATITGYTGSGGDISMPGSLGGYPVTSIGESAFDSENGYLITSVVIPDTVRIIGPSAFHSNPVLTSATIGNGVTTIGDRAFSGCAHLTSIIIPDSVTSLGRFAFSSCAALTSITIGGGVTSIQTETFGSCTSLASLTIPGSVISIGRLAFAGCTSLSSVTISEGVRSIQIQAFLYCTNLTSVTIPGSVNSIWDHAFDHCSSLTSITIPEGVVTLGEYAFAYCSSLNSVIIPGSVTTVYPSVFRNCTSLTSVTISEGFTTIGKGMFLQCSSLTSMTLPSSLRSIGDSAFSNCANLTQITFEGNAPTCFGGFLNHNSALVIYYHAGATGFTNPWEGIPTVAIGSPTGFTYRLINGDAEVEIISYTGSETTLTIPSTIDGKPVTSIGDYTFSSYTPLTSITIPSTVAVIGDHALANCLSLSSITFEGMVAPTVVGDEWVVGASPDLQGHAYAASNFPGPGQYFHGLLMGSNIYVPPTVAVDSPLDGSYLRTSSVTVRWSATDALSEIDYYMVKLDNGKWIKVIGDSYTFTKLKAGTHTVTVQAYGDAGIIAEDSSSFTIDSTAPSVKITSPLNGATIRSSSVTVQWAASDPSGVDYCMVRLDNGAWVKVEDASSYVITELANGKHTVTVQAFDNTGNSKTATVKFTVRT